MSKKKSKKTAKKAKKVLLPSRPEMNTDGYQEYVYMDETGYLIHMDDLQIDMNPNEKIAKYKLVGFVTAKITFEDVT